MANFLSDVDHDKRERIISASLKEFATKGYAEASTNVIVKEAGISKGALFKYFGNKMNLFLRLFEYLNALVEGETLKSGALDKRDVLARLELLFASFGSLLERYPLLLEFMRKAKTDPHPDIAGNVAEIKKNASSALMDGLFLNIDDSLFRDDLGTDSCLYVLQTVLMTKAHEYMYGGSFDMNDFIKDLNSYLTFFRKAFYKDSAPSAAVPETAVLP